jgi:hypothetical protein
MAKMWVEKGDKYVKENGLKAIMKGLMKSRFLNERGVLFFWISK